MFIYVAAAKGVPAEVNVIASMVFLLALVIVIGTQVASNIRQKRLNTLK
jgi:spermidine/putrescine transport system permease protein